MYPFIFLDDNFVDNNVRISPFDRGFIFGDGVYEVTLFSNGKFISLEEHIKRIISSLKGIYIEKDFLTEEFFKKIHYGLVSKNDITNSCFVYLQVTRGVQYNRYNFDFENVKPTVFAFVEEIKIDFDNFVKNGISCKTTPECRRFRRDIKMIDLLPSTVAKIEAKKFGFDDVIFFERDGNIITESSSSNLFIVDQNDVLLTHPANEYILNGTVRLKILELCYKNGIKFQERFFTVDDLYKAKEVFMTGSVKLIIPIINIDDIVIGKGKIGSKTIEISNLYKNFILE